jgi:hypothetical protein
MGWGDHSDGHDRSFGNTSLASFDEWKLASFCETVSQPQLASFGEAARAVHGKASFSRYELSKSGGHAPTPLSSRGGHERVPGIVRRRFASWQLAASPFPSSYTLIIEGRTLARPGNRSTTVCVVITPISTETAVTDSRRFIGSRKLAASPFPSQGN